MKTQIIFSLAAVFIGIGGAFIAAHYRAEASALEAENAEILSAFNGMAEAAQDITRRVDALERAAAERDKRIEAARGADADRREGIAEAPAEWCNAALPAEIRAAFCGGAKQ